MNYSEILSLEYQEQYNQYRWIGTMQSVILTFYGAVTSFSLFAVSKSTGTSSSLSDFLWPSRLLVFFGVLGVIVAIGLIKSRGMQARTAKYLEAMICEMASLSQDPVPDKTALRYRRLCSSQGRFAFLDTSNIATYLAFVFGLLLTAVGLVVAIVIDVEFEADVWLLWFGPLGVLVVVLVVSKWILGAMWNAEQCAVDLDFCNLKDSRGLQECMQKFGYGADDVAGENDK